MFKTKTEELEHFFKTFPDVPKEVVVKEDLLRLGIRYTNKAIKFAAESSTGADRGVIFSIARVKYDELGVDEAVNAPLVVSLQGGMYKLRRLVAENRLNPESPYLVDIVDGQLVLLADGTPIGQVGFPPVPEYYSKKFEDGTWYRDIVLITVPLHRPGRSWCVGLGFYASPVKAVSGSNPWILNHHHQSKMYTINHQYQFDLN